VCRSWIAQELLNGICCFAVLHADKLTNQNPWYKFFILGVSAKESIAMAIITISRQTGSLGDEIVKAAAEKLHYSYVDKIKISDALAELGLAAHDFEKFDGKKPTIWQSMSHQKKKFAFLLRAAVYDFANSGNVIILGRGGQSLLKDIPGTLHVRIVAPFETRIRRLMEMQGYDRKKSEQLIAQNDRDSSEYIRSFFDIDWNDQNMYDLVLNTRTMSVETSTALIIAAITAQEFRDRPEQVEKSLADMALAQLTQGALVGFAGIDLTSVEVAQGVVVLAGLASSHERIEECKKTVSRLKGVKEVRGMLEVVPLVSM
jgi:cytidylate kinase